MLNWASSSSVGASSKWDNTSERACAQVSVPPIDLNNLASVNIVPAEARLNVRGWAQLLAASGSPTRARCVDLPIPLVHLSGLSKKRHVCKKALFKVPTTSAIKLSGEAIAFDQQSAALNDSYHSMSLQDAPSQTIEMYNMHSQNDEKPIIKNEKTY